MDCWTAAKRIYRFVENERFNHHRLDKGMYRVGQRTVGEEHPEYVVVALDPVNFEKPYTKKLEGVSTVHKSTPPDLNGEARLARGYPAMTATVVNTRVPAISYASWFSYKTVAFLSQNREIQRSIRMTRWVFPGQKRRFVMDSGGDDQKLFAFLQPDEFIITATHLERLVEIYHPRLKRWETEHLGDLVDCVLWQATFQAAFHHAGRTRLAKIKMGWFPIRLPETQQKLWVLVAEDDLEKRTLVLLTNIPIRTHHAAQQIYNDWRLRGRIEHGDRVDHTFPVSFGRSKAWTWKMSVSTLSNGCAASSSSSCWRLRSFSTSTNIGRLRLYFGCENSAANWDCHPITMVLISCCAA
jgi:hypothetical protein